MLAKQAEQTKVDYFDLVLQDARKLYRENGWELYFTKKNVVIYLDNVTLKK